MKIEVYADIVFLINFCMDYILLAFMCRILSCRTSHIRRALAAAIGGVGAVCAFYVPTATGVFMQVLLGAAVCAVAAPCRRWKAFAARLAVFYASALIFGGGTLAVLCAVGADVLVKSGAFYINMNIKLLIFAAAVCGALMTVLERLIRRARPECRKTVRVTFMGKTAVLRGYVDTGNTLCCGGVPVILACWDAAGRLFPEGTDSRSFYLACPPDRVRAVSYKAVDGGGVVWCAVPDSVYVGGRKTSALIGVCANPLSEEYDALLTAEM